jgi:hypothetical protein
MDTPIDSNIAQGSEGSFGDSLEPAEASALRELIRERTRLLEEKLQRRKRLRLWMVGGAALGVAAAAVFGVMRSRPDATPAEGSAPVAVAAPPVAKPVARISPSQLAPLAAPLQIWLETYREDLRMLEERYRHHGVPPRLAKQVQPFLMEKARAMAK